MINHMCRPLNMLLFAFVFCEPAMAADCPPRAVDQTKPVLRGGIDDQSARLGLKWASSAGNSQSGGWWTVDNGICNTGQLPLIVDWSKAALGNDAYSPLLSGKELHNDYSVGPDEPSPGGAELKYGGYVARSAQTQIYQAPNGPPKKAASLRSSISGTFARNDEYEAKLDAGIEKGPADSIDVQFEVTPLNEGYKFSVFSKGRSNLELAISSMQNENFVTALRKVGLQTAGAYPLLKLMRRVSTSSAFNRYIDKSFVVMPLMINKEPISLFIPSKLTGVELATVVLLREDRFPIMVGKVSLFQ